LKYYCDSYRQSHFYNSLFWYGTWQLNWEQDWIGEDGKTPLSTQVTQPALMVTVFHHPDMWMNERMKARVPQNNDCQ
jgi:hypothetical protein